VCHWKAKGLEQVTAERTAQAMQVSSDNPMVGLEGRASLLVNLGHALKSNPTFFGADGRPGNMISKHSKCRDSVYTPFAHLTIRAQK